MWVDFFFLEGDAILLLSFIVSGGVRFYVEETSWQESRQLRLQLLGRSRRTLYNHIKEGIKRGIKLAFFVCYFLVTRLVLEMAWLMSVVPSLFNEPKTKHATLKNLKTFKTSALSNQQSENIEMK